MKFSVFTDFGSLNSVPVFNAVIKGLLKLEHEVVVNSLDADVAVIWSLLWHGRMEPNKRIWQEFHRQNKKVLVIEVGNIKSCLLYTSPSPRDKRQSRMPSSA